MEPNGCRVPAKKEKSDLQELEAMSKSGSDQDSP
jgi:hypothetical protein